MSALRLFCESLQPPTGPSPSPAVPARPTAPDSASTAGQAPPTANEFTAPFSDDARSSTAGSPFSHDASATPEGTEGDPVASVFQDPFVHADSAKSKSKKVPGPGDRLRDWTDKQIDDIVNDPEKRIEALLAWDMNIPSKEYKADNDATRMLDDFKTGIDKVNKYLGYFNKAVKYAKVTSSIVGLDKVTKAGAGLLKITGKLTGALGTAKKYIDNFEKGVSFVDAAHKFAIATSTMKPDQRQTLDPWLKSMDNLKDATDPFLDWVRKKGAKAVLKSAEPEVAAAFSVTFNIVTAYLEVGFAALTAGLKVVNAYLDRYDTINKQIDYVVTGIVRDEHGNEMPEPQPEPDDWKSRKERQDDAEASERIALTRRIKESREQEIEHEEKEKDAAKFRFTQDVFPDIYLAHRAEIKKLVEGVLRAQIQASGNGPQSDELRDAWKCFECLKRAPGDEFPPRATDGANGDQALEEIDRFVRLSKPCPAFAKVFDAEYKKYRAKHGW